MRYRILLITLFWGFSLHALAQNTVVISNVPPEIQNLRKLGFKKQVKDSTELQARLELFSYRCRTSGYAAFSIDSVRFSQDTFYVFPYWGTDYSSFLQMDSVTFLFSNKYGLDRMLHNGRLSLADYPSFSSRLLEKLENDGYPFASIDLIMNDESPNDARVQTSLGPAVQYDSIVIKGTLKLRPNFVRAILNWKSGRKYVERNAAAVSTKLKALPYASLTREPGVEFVGNKAILYVFADKRKCNQFDGYVGIVPVSEQSGKVMVTGEANLKLQNVFKIGEKLELRWQAPERYSQYLLVNADFPCWFGTPLGLSGNFTLDKKDTSYLNMRYRAAVTYSFFGTNELQAYFLYATSTILRPELISFSTNDSVALDYRKPMYGLRLAFARLDDAQHPRSGFRLDLDVAAGSRRVLQNAAANPEIYSGMTLKTSTYQMTGTLSGYVPIRKRWGWVANLSGGWSYATQQIYNDLFRIGGTQTLQGFDEKSLYATSYLVAATEFRFWFASFSYLNVFFNGSWYERRLSDSYYFDFPFGFGLGATFHTKAGDFYISYALGQQKNNPVSFKTGKIHFGMDIRF